MRSGPGRIALVVAALTALPGVAAAQFPPPPAPAIRDRWPEPPQPQRQAPPAQSQPQATPARPGPRTAAPAPGDDAPPAKPKPKPAAAPANAIACNGVFGKDTSHRKLAMKYDSRNMMFGEIDGNDGSKMNGTVLFPRDPKRRLEVLWQNEADRSDVSVIVITGQSAWSAPKGLKLGLPLAALEKANGKPFKISGFDDQGVASVTSWENGALASLPGACKVGIRLTADKGAPEAIRKAVEGERELTSGDAALRAVKPTVAEILIGY